MDRAIVEREIEYLRRERDDLFKTLTFAVEMQESVEAKRPHHEGSPKNTIAWIEAAKRALAESGGNEYAYHLPTN